MTTRQAKIDPSAEQANLVRKQRLEYLLERYAPQSLKSTSKLYERLRLRKDAESPLPVRKGIFSLPDALASALEPAGTVKNFGYLLETDVNKRQKGHYQPTQTLEKAMCEGLGWVLAA